MNRLLSTLLPALCLYSISFIDVYCQEPLWKLAANYEKVGNYYEAIRLKKIMAKEDRGTEWFLDDIAGITRCYSYTNDTDSTIYYGQYTIKLAEKLINVSDSIAEEYLQSVAWSFYRSSQYPIAVNAAEKVLSLREKMHGKGSPKHLEWIGIMAYQAFNKRDLVGMAKLCKYEIEISEQIYGINSASFQNAISSVRAYAHQLVDDESQFTTRWIEPYYQKLKISDVLPKYQYEFEILQLEGYLAMGDLQSADKYALALERWTYDSKKDIISLEDRIRIWLKLANFDVHMGDHAKARWRLMKSDKQLAETNSSLSMTQLVERHIVEQQLRMDTLGIPRINAEWIIETSTPIINAGIEDNGTIAFFYGSRAWAYEGLKEYDKAIADMKQSIALEPLYSRKKKLAQLYLYKHEFHLAESEFLALYNDTNLPEVGRKSIEADLASLYWLWGQKTKLIQYLKKDLDNLKSEVRDAFAFMNEQERENFISHSPMGGLINYDVCTSFSNKDEQWGDGNIMAYNIALIQKGLLLNTTKDIERLLQNVPDSLDNTLKVYNELTQIANPIFEFEDIGSRQTRIELMQYVASHPDFLSQMNITYKNVADNLSDGEAAIEFINLHGINPQNLDLSNPYIGALILKSNSTFPTFVRLATVAEADSIYEYDEDGEKCLDYIYAGNSKHKIYKMIWEPLIPYLKDIKTVYYSPTGILQEINLDFIGATEDDLLCQHYNLYRLSSTRELCNKVRKYMRNDAILYGNIAYSSKIPIMDTTTGSKYRSTTRFGFGPLSGTAIEVDSIQARLNICNLPNQAMVKSVATEESFRLLSGNSPKILHLATHGFYYTRDALMQQKQKPNFMVFQAIATNTELYRSGLALSGAQDTWQIDDFNEYWDTDKDSDGILLSAEISKMDLTGTDLVVLSACETALGNITADGVYGLQRAFKLAGVNSLVMSLWKVDDDATQKIMTNFYNYYLNGMSKKDALVKAQRTLRETPGFGDPYYWAGFILLDGLN